MRILKNSQIITLPPMTTNIKCPFLLLFLRIYLIAITGENKIAIYKLICEIPTNKSLINGSLEKFIISII
jgi:hypothetical protein